VVPPAAAETNRRRDDDRASYEDTHGNPPSPWFPAFSRHDYSILSQESCGTWDTVERKRAAGSETQESRLTGERPRMSTITAYAWLLGSYGVLRGRVAADVGFASLDAAP
jgi:hypothetical protein